LTKAADVLMESVAVGWGRLRLLALLYFAAVLQGQHCQLGKTRFKAVGWLVAQLTEGAMRPLVTAHDPSRNRDLAREWPDLIAAFARWPDVPRRALTDLSQHIDVRPRP